MPVPKFSCTKEAIDFGKRATVEDVKVMKNIRAMCIRMVDRLDLDDNKFFKTIDLRMEFATQAQFMRESIEAAQGRIL